MDPHQNVHGCLRISAGFECMPSQVPCDAHLKHCIACDVIQCGAACSEGLTTPGWSMSPDVEEDGLSAGGGIGGKGHFLPVKASPNNRKNCGHEVFIRWTCALLFELRVKARRSVEPSP